MAQKQFFCEYHQKAHQGSVVEDCSFEAHGEENEVEDKAVEHFQEYVTHQVVEEPFCDTPELRQSIRDVMKDYDE
jgi:predicted small metal-binding protein